jgi:hypothetical protein
VRTDGGEHGEEERRGDEERAEEAREGREARREEEELRGVERVRDQERRGADQVVEEAEGHGGRCQLVLVPATAVAVNGAEAGRSRHCRLPCCVLASLRDGGCRAWSLATCACSRVREEGSGMVLGSF